MSDFIFAPKALHALTVSDYTVFTTLLEHEPRDHLIDVGIHAFSANVTSDSDILNLQEKISKATNDRLDILVNCA